MNELLELPPLGHQTNLQSLAVIALLQVQGEIMEEEQKKAEREARRKR